MKIGIDVSTLAYQGSGVTNYTYNLVKNLLTIDKNNEYHLYYSSFHTSRNLTYLEEFEKLGAKLHIFHLPLPVLIFFWSTLNTFPVELLIGKVDIFYFSDFLRSPLFNGTLGATTVHDLVWKKFPQYHEKTIIEAHEKKLKKTIKYGDKIIVDSQSTKNDLLKLYPEIDKNKVFTIYPGIGEYFKKLPDKNRVWETLKKYKIDEEINFLLYVGAVEPRKNLVLSLKIFSELIKDSKFKDYKFLIVGLAGWRKEEVHDQVKKLNLNNSVRFVGYVKDEDLPSFYNAAKLTVYLSSYEGFGLPPLESLSCGTPVLAGNNSSMLETIDKQFLVDVADKDEILVKVKYLLSNKITIDSQAIQKKYNWENLSRQFLKIIMAR